MRGQAVREFWVASGHHLARRRQDGWLMITDELLLAWLARPEILPPEGACAAERALHARLLAAPRAAVAPEQVAELSDPDARENWGYFLAFRDHLLAAGTVEGAYLGIVRDGAALPPLFLDQLVQLVMRNALDGCGDPFVLRAAELFWRPQCGALRDGALILADRELVEALEGAAHAAPLLAMFEGEWPQNLDVMSEANAWTYWSRSDAHVMAMNWGGDPRAREGLAAAITAFLRHLLGLKASITPLTAVSEVEFHWFVGLDADATALGNALWRGDRPALDRLIGLFRIDFTDAGPHAPGGPVWLLMALSQSGNLRLKPQNLVAGLPRSAPPPGSG